MSRGSLVADKLTSLALGNIGLRLRKYVDIPKQIYDVARLIRSCTYDDIIESLGTFGKLTDFKTRIRAGAAYTINEVAESIHGSVGGLIRSDPQLCLSPEERSRHGDFRARYLQGPHRSYDVNEHIINVLATYVFSQHLLEYVESGAEEGAGGRISEAMSTLGRIAGMSNDEKTQFKEERQAPARPCINERALRGSSTEVFYLANQMYCLPKGL